MAASEVTYRRQVTTGSFSWHERLATYMIENPGCTLSELARVFNKTPAWISHIRNTDAFKDYFAGRCDEHFHGVSADLRSRVESVAELAVDEIGERLVESGEEMSMDALLQTADMSLKALGFGRTPQLGLHVGDNSTVIVADQEALDRARERLRQQRENIIDVKVETDDKGEPPPALPPAA